MSTVLPDPDPLPPSVYRRRRLLYFVSTDPSTKKQKWHTLGRTWGEARIEYLRLIQQHRRSNYVAKRLELVEGGDVPKMCLRALLVNAKKNAKSRDLEFEITMADLEALAMASGGRCCMTGIAFQYGVATEAATTGQRRKRLWAPSLDRIDSRVGYIPGNVRLVCFAVNAARQEFGDDVLMKIARALVKYPVDQPDLAPGKGVESSANPIGQPDATASIHAGSSPIQTSVC